MDEELHRIADDENKRLQAHTFSAAALARARPDHEAAGVVADMDCPAGQGR